MRRSLYQLALCTLFASTHCKPSSGAAPSTDAAAESAVLDADRSASTPTHTRVALGHNRWCVIEAVTQKLRCGGAYGAGETVVARGAREVFTADAVACALMDDRSLHCWGQFDGGSSSDSAEPRRPQPIAGATDVAAVLASRSMLCARRTNGTAFCLVPTSSSDTRGELRLHEIEALSDCESLYWIAEPTLLGARTRNGRNAIVNVSTSPDDSWRAESVALTGAVERWTQMSAYTGCAAREGQRVVCVS